MLKQYRVLRLYRRTVSAIPSMKRLVSVSDLMDEPIPFGEKLGQLCPDVVFYLLKDDAGACYWGKLWLNERERLLEPTWEIERYLAKSGRKDLCLAVDVSPNFGLLYRYDYQLFLSTAIVHQWECSNFFEPSECREIEQLASYIVCLKRLSAIKLGILTDFQVTRTSEGLRFLDFEPSRRYAAELAEVRIP